jgi:hypothetical protein
MNYESGFDSRQGREILLFTKAPKSVVRPTQHPLLWLSGLLSSAAKWSWRETDASDTT